ncbi:hypothetical protein [Legionella cincinnatiensis]|uniref:hypothetical protein n=1 Tax=Legionella cincinnatiensis TaxID=28085 RepID=UPI0010417773|nr:hypothetical protein [Legionella cincinnatiensis]
MNENRSEEYVQSHPYIVPGAAQRNPGSAPGYKASKQCERPSHDLLQLMDMMDESFGATCARAEILVQ